MRKMYRKYNKNLRIIGENRKVMTYFTLSYKRPKNIYIVK